MAIERSDQGVEVCVHRERRELVVVEPAALEQLVIERETEGLDQVKVASSVGAQPDDVCLLYTSDAADE